MVSKKAKAKPRAKEKKAEAKPAESPETSLPLISFTELTKEFPDGTVALDRVSFNVFRGEFVFLVGRSGAGKTTLLRLLRRELPWTDGEIYFKEWEISRIPGSKIPLLRRRIAVIFQDYKLLTDRTVWENVAVVLEIVRCPRAEINERVESVLRQVDIWEKRNFFPVQLSGGEAQRTGIARALVIEPDVILADEPTADLDPGTTWGIIELFKKINERGTTVMVATHNFDVVDTLEKRVVTLDRGRLVSDVTRGKYGKEN